MAPLVLDMLSALLCVAGAAFFLAGSLGILRFPDIYSRLHALTKADNLGLGFISLAVALQSTSWSSVAKVVLIWLLALLASATASLLIANAAFAAGREPWRRGEAG